MIDCPASGPATIDSTRAASDALSRDHLNCARAGPTPPSVPARVDLDSIEAVLDTGVAAGGIDDAGAGAGAAGAAIAVRRAVDGAVSVAQVAGGVRAAVGVRRKQHLHLPRGLHTRRGVGAVERDFAQSVVLEHRHLALPHVEVDEVDRRLRVGESAGKVGVIEERLLIVEQRTCADDATDMRLERIRSPETTCRRSTRPGCRRRTGGPMPMVSCRQR